jgi:pyruvate dehydrogenase E2 component (dihydrolipoamide acetyltransferase)
MPSLGADMEAGTLVEWLVKAGDTVRRGDVVAVVETQKGAIEIEIFNVGVVSEIVVPVGALVPVGTVLARLDEAALSTAPAPAPTPTPAPMPRAEVPLARPEPRQTAIPRPAPPSAVPSRPRISPAARRLATQRGIDPAGLTGTGPDGAIVLADIEAARPAAAPAAVSRRRSGFDPAAMRQAIAAAMSRSKREIPHYYLSQTVEISAALARLQSLNQDRAPSDRILPAAMFLRAIALALAATPDLNGYWETVAFGRVTGCISAGPSRCAAAAWSPRRSTTPIASRWMR